MNGPMSVIICSRAHSAGWAKDRVRFPALLMGSAEELIKTWETQMGKEWYGMVWVSTKIGQVSTR